MHKYILLNYKIKPEVFEKMLTYVCNDLRQMFPDLPDAEFTSLYNPQELQRIYEDRKVKREVT